MEGDIVKSTTHKIIKYKIIIKSNTVFMSLSSALPRKQNSALSPYAVGDLVGKILKEAANSFVLGFFFL